MNNLTKTEALPKTGHVNEVCKEWLVREDSALAYKLQSQEINEFYKGNRYRNAVVREDFPTALNEQIKEQENAEKQAEMYRRQLMEQEEHDKRVAKEIADKLERDLQEQRQKDLLQSEMMAQQMQEIYVNLPPVPPPGLRSKERPPPRPAKASILKQNSTEPSTSNGRHNHHFTPNKHNMHQQSSPPPPSQQQQQQQQHQSLPQQQQQHEQPSSQSPQLHQSPIQLQQHHFTNADGLYVGLSLSPHASETPMASGAAPLPVASRQRIQSNHLLVSDESSVTSANSSIQHTTNQFGERPKAGRPLTALTNDNFIITQSTPTPSSLSPHQSQQQYRHQHSSSITSAGSSSSSSSATTSAVRRNVFEPLIGTATNSPNTTSTTTPSSPSTLAPPFAHHHTPLTPTSPKLHTTSTTTTPFAPPPPSASTSSALHSPVVDELIEYSDVADSIRRYDISSNTDAPDSPLHHSNANLNSNFNRLLSPSNENLLRNDHQFQKLSPEKYDQLVGNHGGMGNAAGVVAAERHMQQHADDIELYVDPCDYASLKEIGLPMEEIKEMSKKLKQEQKDELLARRLQELESNDGLTQEERDRMLAIEAQDKELAKMLQEREKAKAKRAKEKARLRKSQQKDSTTLCSTSNGLNCGPLLPLPQDCMSSSKHSSHSSYTSSTVPGSVANNSHAQSPSQEDLLDLEAYSNPIDVIQYQQQQQNQQQQRMPNGTLTNGSLTRDGGQGGRRISNNNNTNNNSNGHSHTHTHSRDRDDDIYTLPVDSCRPGQRPASLCMGPENAHMLPLNSMTRSENYSMESHDSLNGHDISPRMNYSKSGTFDQSSSPTPPYMPIQGTRRSNSSEDRKKKSKDKCTHQ